MKPVSNNDQVEELESLTIYLDSRAEKTEKEDEALAKYQTFENGKVFYFVMTYNSKVVDVLEDPLMRSRYKWNFKRVNEKCFSSYVNYLKHRRPSSLTNANREVFNGKA